MAKVRSRKGNLPSKSEEGPSDPSEAEKPQQPYVPLPLSAKLNWRKILLRVILMTAVMLTVQWMQKKEVKWLAQMYV